MANWAGATAGSGHTRRAFGSNGEVVVQILRLSHSRPFPKRQRAGAVQDLADFSLLYHTGSASDCGSQNKKHRPDKNHCHRFLSAIPPVGVKRLDFGGQAARRRFYFPRV